MNFTEPLRNKLKNKGSATLYSLFIGITILTVAVGFNWLVREHLKASFALSQKMSAFVSAYSLKELLIFCVLPGKVLNKEINLYEGEKYLGIEKIPLNGKEVFLNATILHKDSQISTPPFSLSVQDTNGLISLSVFKTYVFERLLKYLGVEENTRRIIIDSYLDWIDRDDLTRLNGAEKDYYEREGKPYKSRNYFMQYKEELALLRGMDKELYKKIEPFITILSNSGFNPNTAPPLILRAYLDLEDEDTFQNLLKYLENGTILTNRELFQTCGKEIPLEEGVYFYPSLIFDVTIKAGYPKALYTIKGGFDFRVKINTPYEILYWQEG